jgi:hypothetical protein
MPMEEPQPDRWFVLNTGGRRWPELSDVLLAGERVAFVDAARVLPSRFPRIARWFVIVTDRRLICLAKSRRSARKQLHVSLDRITHAYQHGSFGRKVVVVTQHGKLRVHGMNRMAGAQLVTLLVAAIRGDRSLAMAYAVGPAPAPPALPPATAEAHEVLVTRVEELEAHVDRLTQQVRFLEELMHARKQ